MSTTMFKKGKRVVLYADNDDVDSMICERAFKPHEQHIELRTVADGRAVLNWLEGTGPYSNRAFFPRPAVLVLDSQLGDMSGLEVLQWVRGQDRFKEMPVVVYTGSTPADQHGLYHDLNVAAVIEKDAACRTLVDCVRNLVDGELVGR
jgi:DNA-binding response OmpR family regulator